VQSQAQVQLYIELGARRPIHATALGKAILAYLPEAGREEILNQPLRALTEHTVTEPALLRHQLEEIRARGYATDKEEVVPGISCVAAPIFDHTQGVVGALSVAGTDARLHAEVPDLVEPVLAGATTVSLRLGLAPA
jgi:DNA-binding IclR family transcriptional regulator